MSVYIQGVDDSVKKSLLTAIGDLVYASAVSTPSRLAIGATDTLLKVSGGVPAWSATLAGLTLTAPVINGIVTTTGLTLPAVVVAGTGQIGIDQYGIFRYDGASDDSATVVNEVGYQGGTTYFRDCSIRNGKGANILFVDGSAGYVGIGNAAPGALLDLGLAGTTAGVVRLAGVTSGNVTIAVAAAAGAWTMTLPAAVGTAGFQLTDAAGNGVTSWAAAGSLLAYKDLLPEKDWLRPQDALDRILHTRVPAFHFKPGMGTGDTETRYDGVVAEWSPWAAHYQGGVLNPINALGYTTLAIQALNEVSWLKSKVREAMADADFKDWLKGELNGNR